VTSVKKVEYDLPRIGGLVSLIKYVAWLPYQWTKVKLIDLRFEGRRVPVLLCESHETRRVASPLHGSYQHGSVYCSDELT
jgi:hypothetical protein